MERENITMESNLEVVPELRQQSFGVASRCQFTKEELIACGRGELFGSNYPQLPRPPLLMLDRVCEIDADGGEYSRGFIAAELDITPFLWFFKSHFHGDPLMPGCLSIEGLWQLTGFYLGWSAHKGRGRILDSGSTRFVSEVLPSNKLVRFEVHIKRIISRGDVIAVADGMVFVDGNIASKTRGLKIGLFT